LYVYTDNGNAQESSIKEIPVIENGTVSTYFDPAAESSTCHPPPTLTKSGTPDVVST